MRFESNGFTLVTYEPSDIRPTSYVVRGSESGVACGPIGGSSLYLFNDLEEFFLVFGSMKKIAVGYTPGGTRSKDDYCELCFDGFKAGLREVREKNGGTINDTSTGDIQAVFDRTLVQIWFTDAPALSSSELEAMGTLSTYLADKEVSHDLLAMLMTWCKEKDFHGPEASRIDPASVLDRLDETKESFNLPGDEDLVALGINLYNGGLMEFAYPEYEAFVWGREEDEVDEDDGIDE